MLDTIADMKLTLKWIGASALLLVAVIVTFTSLLPKNKPAVGVNIAESPARSLDDIAASTDIDIPFHILEKHRSTSNQDLHESQWIIDQLRTEYADTIQNIAFQVSLKDLKLDLIRQHGDVKGSESFQHIIATAFPNLADDIFFNVQLMQTYDTWYADSFIAMSSLSYDDRQLELWKKRRELFGDDAEAIWTEGLIANDESRVAVNTAVELLNSAHDIPMEERARLLKSAYESNYLGTINDLAINANGLLSQVFFGLDSVQNELESLSDEERQKQIDAMRKEFGFSDEAVAEMAKLDQAQNEAWNTGNAYMQEREAIVNLGGDNQTQALDALRIKHFPDQATTIKREEEDLGLFRYDRPRVYGRN